MDIYYDQPKPAPSKIMTQSLPSYEEFIKQGAENNAKQKENRPIPPPRRSLLKASFRILKSLTLDLERRPTSERTSNSVASASSNNQLFWRHSVNDSKYLHWRYVGTDALSGHVDYKSTGQKHARPESRVLA